MITHLKKLTVNKLTRAFSALSLIFLVGCAVNPYKATNRQYKAQAREYAKQLQARTTLAPNDSFRFPANWAGTVNFNLRKPHYVILHHTAQENCEKTIQTFIKVEREVSAHYLICKDGTVHQMLNDYLRAWHAGQSKCGSVLDVNSVSLGIELDNNGTDTFSTTQVNALLALMNSLKTKYNIPTYNFIGHADVAPDRKVDPNVNFPWQLLAERGFGIWYGDTTLLDVPPSFDPALALRVIGYDSSKFSASLQAFRRHFMRSEDKGPVTEAEKKILYSLMLNAM